MADITRRDALKVLVTASAVAATGCHEVTRESESTGVDPAPAAAARPATEVLPAEPHPVQRVTPLGFPWQTPDPFIACMYHDDDYPAGNEQLGPAASLGGRSLGRDFAGIGGWRMYHGRVVPGFPAHPHRGFETVTVVRRGLLDHSDSLGATARYGGGDVQWLTAGRGIQHAEMFPLLQRDGRNPLELFQLWLNLPRADKMAEPEFKMLWNETMPRRVVDGSTGMTELVVVAGEYDGSRGPQPPRSSWASRPESELAIWTLRMSPGARFSLPPASVGVSRSLYFFDGAELAVAGRDVLVQHRIEVDAARTVALDNGGAPAQLLMLQGRPIGEPVAHRGPFVMNTAEEVEAAYADYRATRFGGWPWSSNDPVHDREQGRFARHPDGRLDHPS